MTQITLTLPDLKKEALIAGACLLAAIALNIYAIVAFKTPWSELFTSALWVLGIAAVFYAMVGGLRLLAYLVRLIIRHSKTGKTS